MEMIRPTAVQTTLRDACYVGVGFGVLAIRQFNIHRREVQTVLDTQVAAGREELSKLAGAARRSVVAVDESVRVVEERVDGLLDRVQDGLPSPADDLLGRARAVQRTTRDQARMMLGLTG